jgi:opacity protein-like surface antigen
MQNNKTTIARDSWLMFKKALLTSIILAASSTVALAATPYVGGSLGVTDLGIYNDGKVQAGAMGKLFGGYGSTFGVNKTIYLGAELNIDLAHYPHNTGATYGLGASFIPGVMITKYMIIYGRIGLETNRNTNSSIMYFGNQLGLGLQTNLAKNWDIRGEYVRYSNVNGNTSGNSQFNLGLIYKF